MRQRRIPVTLAERYCSSWRQEYFRNISGTFPEHPGAPSPCRARLSSLPDVPHQLCPAQLEPQLPQIHPPTPQRKQINPKVRAGALQRICQPWYQAVLGIGLFEGPGLQPWAPLLSPGLSPRVFAGWNCSCFISEL